MQHRIRGLHRLSAVRVKSINEAGSYEDGGGLRLIVSDTGAKSWAIRTTINGTRVMRRLGSYPTVTLEAARKKATEIREGAKAGVDVRAVERVQAVRGTTFRQMFEISFAQRRQQLSNAKHLAQWPSTMEGYVFPFIGNVPVADVTPGQILELLTPIWFNKPETGKRVLQRIETVFKSAIVRGIREKASPCIGVAAELGTQHRNVAHHASMPWQDVPAFIARLREPGPRRWPLTSLALEWAILTASRSGEARGALWSEINVETATWTIPAQRMKARDLHRVPLSPRCIEVLDHARSLHLGGDVIFSSRKSNKPLSDMTLTKLMRDAGLLYVPHGFRSSFKIWATEEAKAQHEVSEAALAHVIKDKVVAAYLRSDFFEQRRALMQRWADHCCPRD